MVMQTERRRYADPCGIARALDIVGERWTLLIVRELTLGPRRFGHIKDGLPDVSPNVLAQRLRDLEENGIVRRTVLEPPASVPVYELTERGRALEPVLLELGRWGSATPRLRSGRELSVAAMMFALRTMFEPATTDRVTYGLQLGDEQYAVRIGEGRIDISRGRPDAADAYLDTDVTMLRTLVFLGTGMRIAEEAGKLRITGDRRAAARFPKYFRKPAVE
jgi:DNA-binding HxlR family transcriptional regulator